MTNNQILLLIYSSYLSCSSLITFCLYLLDKKRAIKNKRRIKEKTLMCFTICGGGLGAIFGSILWHHKTNKIYFNLVNTLAGSFQIVILVFYIFKVI